MSWLHGQRVSITEHPLVANWQGMVVSVCVFLNSIPFIIFALFLLSLLVVTQIRGRITDSSPSTTVRALHFYRENISALSSLVDSLRIVPTHAINRRSQQ